MDILDKIKMMQKSRNWNDADLAKAAGITKSTLSSLHQRNNIPTIPTLQAICHAFGITIAQFFSDSNVPLDLTAEQINLLEHWNPLSNEQKEALINLMKCIQ